MQVIPHHSRAATASMAHGEGVQAEYKEFLALGHGDIFELDVAKAVSMDRFGTPQQPPWMVPGADLSDYFNYGMDTDGWRCYCAAVAAFKCAAPRSCIPHALPGRMHVLASVGSPQRAGAPSL